MGSVNWWSQIGVRPCWICPRWKPYCLRLSVAAGGLAVYKNGSLPWPLVWKPALVLPANTIVWPRLIHLPYRSSMIRGPQEEAADLQARDTDDQRNISRLFESLILWAVLGKLGKSLNDLSKDGNMATWSNNIYVDFIFSFNYIDIKWALFLLFGFLLQFNYYCLIYMYYPHVG